MTNFQATDDFSYIGVTSGASVIIYKKTANTFVQNQLLTMAFTISGFSMSSGYFVVHAQIMSNFYIYKSDPAGNYVFEQIVPSAEMFLTNSNLQKNA